MFIPEFFLKRAIELNQEMKKNYVCHYSTARVRQINEDIYMYLKGYPKSKWDEIRKDLSKKYY